MGSGECRGRLKLGSNLPGVGPLDATRVLGILLAQPSDHVNGQGILGGIVSRHFDFDLGGFITANRFADGPGFSGVSVVFAKLSVGSDQSGFEQPFGLFHSKEVVGLSAMRQAAFQRGHHQ